MKNLNTLLFVSFGILLLATSSYAHGDYECVHDQIQEEIIPGMEHEDPTGRKRALADWAPFRIATDFSNLNFSDNDYPGVKDKIKNFMIPAAMRWFSLAYQIKQYTEPLQAPKGMNSCGSVAKGTFVNLPASIINGNSLPNTDLMVVVSYGYENASWAARAYACASDAKTGRNYIGAMQYNLFNFNFNDSDWDSQLGTTLHEFTHVLFMSGSLFPKYYNETLGAAYAKNINQTIAIGGINTTVLTHPRLVEEAKRYYGCDNISYVRIEQQGESGSAGSHWERKWFGNEFIVAQKIGRRPVSNFTLILAEVSGWYKSNFTMAEVFIWGKGRGCDFLHGPCVSNSSGAFTAVGPEYCSQNNLKGCDFENYWYSICKLQTSSTPVPDAWNYFGDNYTMGTDTFSDNCPIMSKNGAKNCESPFSTSPGFSTEYFGGDSACFVSSFTSTKWVPLSSPMGQCYQYECNLQSNGNYRIDISLDGAKTSCYSKDQQILPPSGTANTGTLTCPDPNAFCQFKLDLCPKRCGGAGTCNKNGQCQCNADRQGPDCLRDAPKPVTTTTL